LLQIILVGEINNFKTKSIKLLKSDYMLNRKVENRMTADVSPDRKGTAAKRT
jgi:hypothetical protein